MTAMKTRIGALADRFAGKVLKQEEAAGCWPSGCCGRCRTRLICGGGTFCSSWSANDPCC